MQRLQRRFTLLFAALLATVLTTLTVAPASAADKPSRSNGDGNRVIFVHGFAPSGKHDCADYFRTARAHFSNNGWEKKKLLTFGYYSGNKNCSYNAGGSRDTSIKEVAKKFANYVYKYYTKKGKKIDVVAHSMGGLVVRAALHHTHKGTKNFPKKLYIEDVVTLGTPHAGASSNWLGTCNATVKWTQCKDVTPGSAFLKTLPKKMPSSKKKGMGTDWTSVSSFDDGTVSESSGIAGTADHEVQYRAGISHTELRTVSSGSHNGRIKYSTTWTDWHKRISPVGQARLAVYWHSTT